MCGSVASLTLSANMMDYLFADDSQLYNFILNTQLFIFFHLINLTILDYGVIVLGILVQVAHLDFGLTSLTNAFYRLKSVVLRVIRIKYLYLKHYFHEYLLIFHR